MGLTPFILMMNSQAQTVVEPEPEPTGTPPAIEEIFRTVSNKYVDIVFDRGVYVDEDGVDPVTSSNFSIIDFVPGGVTNVAIAAVKRNTHYTSGTALALLGGESVVRVFLTLTGTPDSTESFRIRCTDVFSPDGTPATLSTDTVKLNITPIALWDYLETASVTTTGLGISTLADVMGLASFTQTTDANRPLDGTNEVIFNSATPKYMTAGDVASLEFQKGNSFTVVVKRFKPTNSGAGGYLISKRGPAASQRGWSISVGVDGSLFFVLHDGTSQGFCDYDGFSPAGSEHDLFFINDNGTLNIRDANWNILGTTGNATGIGTITYGTLPVWLGRRDTDTSNSYLSGSVGKISIATKALSMDEGMDFLENTN
jgi:hypothetical protein